MGSSLSVVATPEIFICSHHRVRFQWFNYMYVYPLYFFSFPLPRCITTFLFLLLIHIFSMCQMIWLIRWPCLLVYISSHIIRRLTITFVCRNFVPDYLWWSSEPSSRRNLHCWWLPVPPLLGRWKVFTFCSSCKNMNFHEWGNEGQAYKLERVDRWHVFEGTVQPWTTQSQKTLATRWHHLLPLLPISSIFNTHYNFI